MITVEIPKKELLRQLPEKAGYALLQWLDEMPNTFMFEALPIRTKEELVIEQYPSVLKLSGTEQRIFLTLHARGKVNRSTLEAIMRPDDPTFIWLSNAVDVHVKNLRRRLRELGLPFSLVTYEKKSTYQGQTHYRLIKKF